MNLIEKIKNLPFDYLNDSIYNDNLDWSQIPKQYTEFLKWKDGGRLENCVIKFKLNGADYEEYLDTFMSYNFLVTNDYLIGYEPYFDNPSEDLSQFKDIMANYMVFCSTLEPNTYFALSKNNFGKVYYLDFDESPTKVSLVFEDLEAFIDEISTY